MSVTSYASYDLNVLQNEGKYAIDSVTNGPTSGAFFVRVEEASVAGNAIIIQEAFNVATGESSTRVRAPTTGWSAWNSLYTETVTAEQVGTYGEGDTVAKEQTYNLVVPVDIPVASVEYAYMQEQTMNVSPGAGVTDLTGLRSQGLQYVLNIDADINFYTAQAGNFNTVVNGDGDSVSLIGAFGEVTINGDGDHNFATGFGTNIYALGDGTLTTGQCFGAYAQGNITNAYALRMAGYSGSITNKWGVYIADTGAVTYLGGSLGVGSGVTAPVVNLEVNGAIKKAVYTVATLPAATLGDGISAYVSDADDTLANTLGDVVAGGGANFVPVFSDNDTWRVG